MNRKLFNLFSLLVILALLLPAGGMPVTAQGPQAMRPGPAAESVNVASAADTLENSVAGSPPSATRLSASTPPAYVDVRDHGPDPQTMPEFRTLKTG